MNFLLVHGAGEEPSVWDGWEGTAIDLQAGLSVRVASMLNYEAVVACDGALIARPLCLVGRGMGALAVLLAARRVLPVALVLVEPWPPAGAGSPPEEPLARATRPESPLVLKECRRGLEAPRPEAPTLVVRNRAVAELYGAEELDAPDLAHAVSAWAFRATARV